MNPHKFFLYGRYVVLERQCEVMDSITSKLCDFEKIRKELDSIKSKLTDQDFFYLKLRPMGPEKTAPNLSFQVGRITALSECLIIYKEVLNNNDTQAFHKSPNVDSVNTAMQECAVLWHEHNNLEYELNEIIK